jgi:hypothetical protein
MIKILAAGWVIYSVISPVHKERSRPYFTIRVCGALCPGALFCSTSIINRPELFSDRGIYQLMASIKTSLIPLLTQDGT